MSMSFKKFLKEHKEDSGSNTMHPKHILKSLCFLLQDQKHYHKSPSAQNAESFTKEEKQAQTRSQLNKSSRYNFGFLSNNHHTKSPFYKFIWPNYYSSQTRMSRAFGGDSRILFTIIWGNSQPAVCWLRGEICQDSWCLLPCMYSYGDVHGT